MFEPIAQITCNSDLHEALTTKFILVGVDTERSENQQLIKMLRLTTMRTSAIMIVDPLVQGGVGAIEWPLNCWFRVLYEPLIDVAANVCCGILDMSYSQVELVSILITSAIEDTIRRSHKPNLQGKADSFHKLR